MTYTTSLPLVLCILIVSYISYTQVQAFTFIQPSRSIISSTSRASAKPKEATKDDEDVVSSPFFFASVSDGSNSTNSALIGAGVVGTTAVVLSEGMFCISYDIMVCILCLAYCLFNMIYMILCSAYNMLLMSNVLFGIAYI